MLANVLLFGDSFGFMFVVGVIGGVVALVVWSISHQKKIRQSWLEFARRNNLSVQGAANRPAVNGWYGSTFIALNTVVRGSGKNRSTYTQHHATINAPMPQGLVLYKESVFSKVGKVFGGQDVQTGDRALDDAFIIKGQDLLGIHKLLNIPAVKKALLYVIARHPGIRIDQQSILVETSGMTGGVPKLEGIFSDLAYVAQTLDAGYQELMEVSGRPEQAPTRAKAQAAPVQTSKAAAAEILGAGFFDSQVRGGEPQVRQAGPEETPADRAAAFAQMADVLHQYEEKLESGEAVPAQDDGFTTPDSSKLFDEYKPESTWQRDDSAFGDPDTGDAFDNPEPIETSPAAEASTEPEFSEEAGSFQGLIGKLSDRDVMSRDREQLIDRHKGTDWELELVVDRVDSTWGFDVPDDLKDGKTVEAHLKGSDAKVAIRFPKGRNDEIGNLKSGNDLKAWGHLTGWDDLFKKATLNGK